MPVLLVHCYVEAEVFLSFYFYYKKKNGGGGLSAIDQLSVWRVTAHLFCKITFYKFDQTWMLRGLFKSLIQSMNSILALANTTDNQHKVCLIPLCWICLCHSLTHSHTHTHTHRHTHTHTHTHTHNHTHTQHQTHRHTHTHTTQTHNTPHTHTPHTHTHLILPAILISLRLHC